MMRAKILVAGIVGGLAMFIWGAISHMALPLGTMGLTSLPNDEAFTSQFKQTIPERGFYFFPGMDLNNPSPESEKAFQEKHKAGPTGILIYDPVGRDVMSPAQLATEFASNVLAALVAAVLLARIPGSVFSRAMLGAAMGLMAWASIDLSYWNWYRFPDAFTVAQFLDQTIGWTLTAAAIAMVLGRPRPAYA